MAEFLFVFGLVSPILLMLWLTWARKRAHAKVAAMNFPEPKGDRFGFDELQTEEDGMTFAKQHSADHELLPPDHSGGEVGGIRAMQGRR